MPDFVFRDSDGAEWDVTAPDQESATKAFGEHRQKALNAKRAEEYNAPPEWAKMLPPEQQNAAAEWMKPFRAADDAVRVGGNALTAGLLDKGIGYFTGQDESAETEARRARMGSAAIPTEILGGVATGTTVPAITKFMGGGPLARGLIGTTAAGIEGGAVGGINAATHDQPVGEGMAIGAAGGTIGQQLGSATNRIAKWWKGVDDSVPQGIRSGFTVVPKKGATPTDKVTVADNEAALYAKGKDDPLARQERVKENFKKLYQNEGKTYTPEQRSLMANVFDEDPATKGSRILGDLLTNKLVAGAGAGGGFMGGGIPGALATYGGIMGAGRAMKGVSMGGTEEAVTDLRRAMAGRKKYQGMLSPENAARITKGTRQIMLDAYGNPIEEY